ncbi:HAD-IB family hydrolase [Proteiniclasticum sp. QWL-01]|uniref:HAD-IB family hydrolase n=1 Tax=Proteiniclasticum sp. QWL-01 TaxID=3036945 RepID=UPI0021FA4471|nr:HAD-IB family hydrolase [Proteiniclasticum sp. QWL-01]UUM12557.1 HAD-IB family hydrolase [Clostridiaceae bacterium HFYG-1003]WFF74113.1 HAD-IB family hydrolase [Proteiniclasticum sp. QWL-01]
MKKTAAFFDIDGTLYREGFIADLFKMLVKCEIISYEQWYDEVRPEFVNWDRRLGTYDMYLLKMSSMYTQAIMGHHRSLVQHIVKRVIEDKAMRTYVYTRQRIQWHKEQGHMCITVSGSPYELVGAMAKFYGFDDFRGSRYLMDRNHRYTGEIIPMWTAESKQQALEELAVTHDIDLSQSWSYGDTAADISMFRLTGYPNLINPTRELINLVRNDPELMAKATCIVERKDVIYRMNLSQVELVDDRTNHTV